MIEPSKRSSFTTFKPARLMFCMVLLLILAPWPYRESRYRFACVPKGEFYHRAYTLASSLSSLGQDQERNSTHRLLQQNQMYCLQKPSPEHPFPSISTETAYVPLAYARG